MPTKTKVHDPLIDELPPAEERKPQTPEEVKFDVDVEPYVTGGKIYWRWTIVDHNAKGYVGDYSGHSNAALHCAECAADDAKEYVARIRQTLALKLSAPDVMRLTI